MKVHHVATWMLLASLMLAGLLAAAAEPKSSVPPPPKPGTTAATEQESLELRYARLQLELAEANLHRAQRMNQKVANAVAANVVAEYQRLVDVARANVEARLQKEAGEPLADWLREVQAAVQTAESRYRTALAVNRRMPGTIDQWEVERLRILAELARVQLQLGQAAAKKPFDVQVRWQLDLLRTEIQQIQEQLRRTPPSSGAYPIYPYWWY